MNIYLTLATGFLLLGLVYAYLERNRFLRWGILGLVLTVVPLTYIASIELLGHCKPVKREFFKNPDKVVVLGKKIVQDVGIYLFLDHKEWSEPYCYFLDWQEGEKLVKELQERGDEARRKGKYLQLKTPFKGNLQPTDVWQPPPPESNPPK